MKSRKIVVMGYENTEGGSILNKEFITESLGESAAVTIIDQSNRQQVMNRSGPLQTASLVVLSYNLANEFEKYDIKKTIDDIKRHNQAVEILIVPIKREQISSNEEENAKVEMKKFINENKLQIIEPPQPPSYDVSAEDKSENHIFGKISAPKYSEFESENKIEKIPPIPSYMNKSESPPLMSTTALLFSKNLNVDVAKVESEQERKKAERIAEIEKQNAREDERARKAEISAIVTHNCPSPSRAAI